MPSAIIEEHHSSASDFLARLSLAEGPWGARKHFWCFRGHADDAYKLLPSALRDQALLGYSHDLRHGVQRTNRKQLWAELAALHEFYWSCDASGLHLPTEGQLLRTPDGWGTLLADIQGGRGWPSDSVLSLMALAQHYGVHTRLLDWTERPLVAAYFAAVGAAGRAIRADGTPERLGLWGLDLDWVIFSAWPASRKCRVYVVTAPRSTNPNMHAQGGVFTADVVTPRSLDGRVVVETVDSLVRVRARVLRCKSPVMCHLTLDATHAPELLRLLHASGISAASLFPGFGGVVQAMRERARWDRPERSTYWCLPFVPV